MTTFLFAAAAVILATVAFGLARILRGPRDADRVMAVALIGTGGVAALILAGVAARVPSVVDVALTLALLAAFASVAFARAADPATNRTGTETGTEAEDDAWPH